MSRLLILAALLTACAETPAEFTEIESPAGPGSGEPSLFVANDGTTFLSWVESSDEGHALRFSTLAKGRWNDPRTIASGRDWFVNWADVPSLIALNDGTLVAHWLVENGPDTYAYEIRISFSHDLGITWSKPQVLHQDGTQTEHGFVTLMPWQDDELMAVWLDGRQYAAHQNESGATIQPTEEMTLRAARLTRSGQRIEESVLDTRVCDCCPTTATLTADGIVAAYRDRSPKEIRDIGIARYTDGSWGEPTVPVPDHWEVGGCPVNGPALHARKNVVALAWFTAANNEARVKLAISTDGGATFGDAIVVDDGDPEGRVDVVVLDDLVLVSWLELVQDSAEVRLRAVTLEGELQPSSLVTQSSSERASGFPRMVWDGQRVIFAWTVAGEPSAVRTAIMQRPTR